MRSRSAREKPSSRIDGAGQAQGLGRTHHREVVDRSADGQPADVAAREEDRVHDVGIGRQDSQRSPEPQRGAVVHGFQAPRGHRRAAGSGQEDLLDQGAHRAAPRPVLEGDPGLRRRRRDGDQLTAHLADRECPPYWCQILQVPSRRDHAGAHGSVGHALLSEEGAVGRVGDAGHDVAADAAGRRGRRRVVPQRRQVDLEALARVQVRPFVAQAAGFRWGRGRCRASARPAARTRSTAPAGPGGCPPWSRSAETC